MVQQTLAHPRFSSHPFFTCFPNWNCGEHGDAGQALVPIARSYSPLIDLYFAVRNPGSILERDR